MALNKDSSVLLVGESWVVHSTEIKGLVSYDVSRGETAGQKFISAIEGAGANVVHITNEAACEGFPEDLQSLKKYAVIVFSDVASDTLLLSRKTCRECQTRENPLELVRQYVAEGGGFCMIGGHVSFQGYQGIANYRNTILAQLLPVDMLPGDDRVEAPQGVRPKPRMAHQVLDGLQGEWPVYLGYNRLIAKRGAHVLLTCDDDPFLVVSDYGKGRVAAFASDCAQHWATPEALNWEGYGRFWVQLIRWLAGREQGEPVTTIS